MRRIAGGRFIYLGAIALFATVSPVLADIPVGYISWDVTFPGNAGEFDIVNLTGANSGGAFPITTTVLLSSLNLVVNFVGGSTQTFGPASGYFTLDPDGQSFDGSAIPIGGTNPLPLDATLTGTFSPLTIDAGAGPVAIQPGFTTTISDSPNLVDGDFGIIGASPTSATPEPGDWVMLSMGVFGLLGAKSRLARRGVGTVLKAGAFLLRGGLLPVLCLFIVQAALGQVKLPVETSPSSGVSGVTQVNLTGSGFPSGTITPANVVVTLSHTCGGAAAATTSAVSVRTILGSTDRVAFGIPAGIATGTYFVTVADTAVGDADFTTIAGSCSTVAVTGSSAVLNACVAGSSMGVLLPKGGATGNVTAYVPRGYWSGGGTGVLVQNIEGTLGSFTTVPTPNIPNSCSANPATGQTVCVANNTDVYLITGTTLNTTLTSGSNRTASFSGGTCRNCGVAVNANNNTAVINMGLSGGGSGDGVQVLDLNTNTFTASLGMNQVVSENISVDPTRSLILSAGEGENYTLVQIQSNGTLKEFDSSFFTGIENDSSAEDCSTGIAITPGEFTNTVGMVNLNAITFGATTYSAPNANATLSTAYSFSAGLSGSAVAQGSGHLAVVTGEFGGNTFAVLQLPSTPGAATPALVDYAVASIPSSAACGGFNAGFDPHTITAYTSPNTGHSYAVFAGYSGGVPNCLAVVDMTMVINPAISIRGGSGFGAHDVSPANLPAAAVAFFPL